MRIKYKTEGEKKDINLVDFICMSLERSEACEFDRKNGITETNAYSAQSGLARLIEILCEKKVLDAADVVDIASKVYDVPEDEELVPTEESEKYREIQPIKTSFKLEITN